VLLVAVGHLEGLEDLFSGEAHFDELADHLLVEVGGDRLLLLEVLLLDLALPEERDADLAVLDVELAADEVNAALVSLQIVEPEEQVHLVVLEHSEAALEEDAPNLHICQVYPSENLALTHSNGHTRKSGVQKMHDVALISALF